MYACDNNMFVLTGVNASFDSWKGLDNWGKIHGDSWGACLLKDCKILMTSYSFIRLKNKCA